MLIFNENFWLAMMILGWLLGGFTAYFFHNLYTSYKKRYRPVCAKVCNIISKTLVNTGIVLFVISIIALSIISIKGGL